MSLLRQRMLEDLRLRNYSPRTQKTYIDHVARLARFFGRSPNRLGPEHIRTFMLHLREELKLSASTQRQTIAALRFFYVVTLKRRWDVDVVLPVPRVERKLPVVLSRQEVSLLIEAAHGLRNRALLMTTYSTGARVSEIVNLKVSDIDSDRNTVRIRCGKGAKDRYVPLSPLLLETLREYYRQHRPKVWLFPGVTQERHICKDVVQKACRDARDRAGIKKRVTPHVLRHTFATHLFEAGIDLFTIRDLLGHGSIQMVQRYTHLSKASIRVERPGLDLLGSLDLAPR